MATHSYAYIPTNRKPNEYIMSEGWSGGMLNGTGFQWYESTPRMNEAIRATMLLDGSPVFAPAGKKGFDIHQIDYMEENVQDTIEEQDEDFVASVGETLIALESGDWATAESTAYGKMTLEEKMAMGLTMNTTLHTISDFIDLPERYRKDRTTHAYDVPMLVEALKQYDPQYGYTDDIEDACQSVPSVQRYRPDVHCWYFYHSTLNQWWGMVRMPDNSDMLIPLIVAFFIEGRNTLQDVKALHAQYPNVYAKDIAELAQFEAARSA